MLHLPPSEVNVVKRLHTKTTTSSMDWGISYITYVISSLCIDGWHKKRLRTSAQWQQHYPIKEPFMDTCCQCFTAQCSTICTLRDTKIHIRRVQIFCANMKIFVWKLVMCSLNNTSMTAFSGYSYEIFYISFQPYNVTFLMKTTSTSQHSSWNTSYWK